MNFDTEGDGVSAADVSRELFELESEAATIASAIGSAIRAGDLLTADELTARRERLPLLRAVAEAHRLKLALAELADEAAQLDLDMPELARAVQVANADTLTVEDECKRRILAARHRAASAVGELRAVQYRRRDVEQRTGELRAELARVGSTSTPATPARVATPGESSARPSPVYIVGEGVTSVG